MRPGSNEKTSGQGGGVGGPDEVGGDCTRAASIGDGDVGDASVVGGVKKFITAEGGEGCSGVVHGSKGRRFGEGCNGVGEGGGGGIGAEGGEGC